MDDRFLQRMRVEPPAEFLAGLKARLDRQKPAPAPSPKRSVTWALIAAFVLGGVAMAAASLAWRVLPSLWSTPVPDTAQPNAQQAHSASTQVLAPHEMHVPARVSTPPVVPSPSVPAEPARVEAPQGPRDYVSIVGSDALFPYTAAATEQFRRSRAALPRTHVESTSAALAHLCAEADSDSPDIAQASRPINSEELQTCTKNGVGVIELPLGREAVVLARAKLYGALKLSPREVFLALAKRIPDPAHPQSTIENPNTTWNQVSDALPYDRIAVFGPALSSALGRAFVALLIEKGCNTYPWLAALKDLDEERYDGICRTLRADGFYTAAPDYPANLISQLETNPTALGVFNLPLYTANSAALVGASIDGVDPSYASVESGAYAAARSLFLYVNRGHVTRVPGLRNFLWSYLDTVMPYGRGFGIRSDGALIPPDKAARDAVSRNLVSLKSLNP